MLANDQGPHVVARLLGDTPVDADDLHRLGEPWLGLALIVLRAGNVDDRLAALKRALVDHPDRIAIMAQLKAAARIVAQPIAARSEDTDTLVHLDDVPSRPVRWLWPGRVPLGKLTVLDGDPGLGKSAITLDLAARVSRGSPMPDHTLGDLDGPRGVVLLSAEDGLADTIRPRLHAAGADLPRVFALTAVLDRPTPHRRPDGTKPPGRPIFRLPTLGDLDALRRAVAAAEAALVVVDPIMAHLPREVDSGRDSAVRALLARLAALAEAEDVAVLVVRHLTKLGRGNPLYRGGGSIGIIGAARSGLLVAKDPSDPTGARRVLASTKANLALAPTALAYHLAPAASEEGSSLRIVWEGASDQTAETLLDAPTASPRDEPSALDEARELLGSALADGPKPATTILAEARTAGVSQASLRRARVALGIRPRKDGVRRCWLWQLPTRSADD